MYYVIGLRKDGKMALFDSCDEMPDADELANSIKGFGYTQLLIVGEEESFVGAGQVARFEYEDSPRLKEVDLA